MNDKESLNSHRQLRLPDLHIFDSPNLTGFARVRINADLKENEPGTLEFGEEVQLFEGFNNLWEAKTAGARKID